MRPSRNDSGSAAPASTIRGRLARSVTALALALLAALPLWSFFGLETVPAARALVVAMAVLAVAWHAWRSEARLA